MFNVHDKYRIGHIKQPGLLLSYDMRTVRRAASRAVDMLQVCFASCCRPVLLLLVVIL